MKRSWKWTVLAGGLATLCGAFITGRSWADGIPATGALAYSGRLEAPNGDPLTGSHNLEVKLWDAGSDGNSLCPSNSEAVTLEQGRFTLTLLDECTDAVQANADVWVEILVDGTSLGRTKTGAVPYAVEASHATTADVAGSADTLGALAPGDVQERVTGGCGNANQSIKTINADGTVTCETDDNTTYTEGSGIDVSGTTISADTAYLQRRVVNSCTSSQFIRTVGADGVLNCGLAVTTVSAGSGLTSSPASPASGAVTVSIPSNGVTRSHLSGNEVSVRRKHASCGDGLTDLTTCSTLPCEVRDFLTAGNRVLWYFDCDGDCSTPFTPVTCTNPSTVQGYLVQ